MKVGQVHLVCKALSSQQWIRARAAESCDILSILRNLIKIMKFSQNCKILPKLWNSVKIVKFCQNCEILSKLWYSVEIVKFGWKLMSEHCVRYCTLMMVCGIVLGKAKTTKGWYELNIVNEWMNQWMTEVGIELLGQLKSYQL